MPCYHPVAAYRAAVPNEKGRRPIFFSRRASGSDERIDLACGQCSGCRLERARQWAVRCMHEASLYMHNCFITLTYDDQNLPQGGTLVSRDLQLFLKRMRQHVFRKQRRRFRFYGCGEYGEKSFRPHYHLLVFDYDFPDKTPWRKSPSGHQLFRSDALESLWALGSSEIGAVSFQSAGYVAGYCLKKITGEKAGEHYLRVDADGCYYSLLPEFSRQSLGIGRPWLQRFKTDVYPSDFIVVNGQKVLPPKYYDRCLEKEAPDEFDVVRERRDFQSVEAQALALEESSRDRLRVKEEVAASRRATFSGRTL